MTDSRKDRVFKSQWVQRFLAAARREPSGVTWIEQQGGEDG